MRRSGVRFPKAAPLFPLVSDRLAPVASRGDARFRADSPHLVRTEAMEGLVEAVCNLASQHVVEVVPQPIVAALSALAAESLSGTGVRPRS
jgi:hypothetical protein